MGWQQAWQEALYGEAGFYRSPGGPAAHFSTSTHGLLGQVLAGALLRLAREEGCRHVVDVGCGRGELLRHLRELDPAIALTGVEVTARPAGLPGDIGWLESPGGSALPADLGPLDGALVVAHEWLDVVPCTVAEVDGTGAVREVLVDPASGQEQAGGPLSAEEAQWVERHWPGAAPGDRVEVGLARDHAWGLVLGRLRRGTALAVDYGHRRGERPAGGTLAAYRAGAATTPVPDGSCDVTAHVAVDSLDHDELLDQRTALRRLGVRGSLPPAATAARDPAAYLSALSRASAAGALTARGGFGDFWWAVKRVP